MRTACSRKLSLSVNSAHLAFSREIMGADILEKLSLKLSFIVLCIAENSLYRSTHAAHRQKVSLSANSAHLAFSGEICGGCNIGKTLFKTVFIALCVPHIAKNSLEMAKKSENKNQLSLRTKQF